MNMMHDTTLLPRELSVIDAKIKRHAVLSSVGFIILLPLGALVARYTRTYFRGWFWTHALIQFLISGPIIFAGWAMGYQTTNSINTGGNWVDTHKKVGLALLILYLFQLAGGVMIHFFKTPRSFLNGHRPPQNYFHAFMGLAIIALAFYQVHYGITIEWYEATLDGTVVPSSALHAWEALIVIFWVLYAAGLVLLPRQYKQESAGRNAAGEKQMASASP